MSDTIWRMENGDSLTIDGYYELIRNPGRRWWQWWKPEYVKGPNLRVWKIIAHHPDLGNIAQ